MTGRQNTDSQGWREVSDETSCARGLQAIASMIDRSEWAQEKFAEGTAQYTLLENRINALRIASSLIKNELAEESNADAYTKEALEKALAPIISLISKSEKAQEKLAQGTWQHTMLENNLKALHRALPLLQGVIARISQA